MLSKMMKESFPRLKATTVSPKTPHLADQLRWQPARKLREPEIACPDAASTKTAAAPGYNRVIPLDQTMTRVVKRAIDLFCAVAVIVVVFPWLIPIIGLVITMDSPGPIFFLQKRNGRNGVPFTCMKFRSMRLNRHSDLTPARQNDPRITRVGRILRSYCIDELPQFFNVLLGDMTLVGPRPHMIRENLIFSQSVADYAFRFRVKPGITGLGQLRGSTRGTRRERMTDRAYWDAFYILNWSLKMDIKILFSTLAFCCGGGHKDHAILIQPLT